MITEKKNGITTIRQTPEEAARTKAGLAVLDKKEMAQARKMLRDVLAPFRGAGAPERRVLEEAFNRQIFMRNVIRARRQMDVTLFRIRGAGWRWRLPEYDPRRLLRSIIEAGGETTRETILGRFKEAGLSGRDLQKALSLLRVRVTQRPGGQESWSLPRGRRG